MVDEFAPLIPETKRRARSLRRDLTGPERQLWNVLRGSRLAGLKFRRQHPIGKFIVDFCCVEERLVIELDGDSHIGQFEQDRSRQDRIEGEGYRVTRFGNDDVIENLEGVAMAILKACGRNPFTGERMDTSESEVQTMKMESEL